MGRILQMHANKREQRDEVFAGDIAAVIGLKDVRTGDTLSQLDKPIILQAMKFPERVISVAIEPKTPADEDKPKLCKYYQEFGKCSRGNGCRFAH